MHCKTYQSNMDTLKVADLNGIQEDILINGFPKKAEIFCFFTIRAPQAFCQNIQAVANSKIATGKDIKDLREQISNSNGTIIDVAKTNIAFTSGGLTKVGLWDQAKSDCKLTDTAKQRAIDTSKRSQWPAKLGTIVRWWHAK